MFDRGDADKARGRVAEGAEIGQLAVELRQERRETPDQTLACLGGGDTARRARKQSQPEPVLEPPHDLAQRGLRDAQTGCRPSEAALFGNCHEGCQIGDILAPHLSSRL